MGGIRTAVRHLCLIVLFIPRLFGLIEARPRLNLGGTLYRPRCGFGGCSGKGADGRRMVGDSTSSLRDVNGNIGWTVHPPNSLGSTVWYCLIRSPYYFTICMSKFCLHFSRRGWDNFRMSDPSKLIVL